MHNRRRPGTATFLTAVAASLVVLTVTSTATSFPQSASTSTVTASASRTSPSTSPRPTTAPTTVPLEISATTPITAPPATPTTTEAPAATVEVPPAPSAAPTDPLTAAREALDSVVPSGWFGSDDLQWELLGGSSSMATNNPPTIGVGSLHFENPSKLRFILAHEWGHHVAFFYGDPDLSPGHPPIEMWAGCVAEVLVPDYWISTHGLPQCPPSAKSFTAEFLAAGPY